uniref:hypothetical protein n=1 Tax=Candidatus Electronema sp. TaxID=2698783 RepID=UPI0040575522
MAHPQYVVDAAQPRTAVLIPAAEWEEILEALEDLDDIWAYDVAKKAEGQEAVPSPCQPAAPNPPLAQKTRLGCSAML